MIAYFRDLISKLIPEHVRSSALPLQILGIKLLRQSCSGNWIQGYLVDPAFVSDQGLVSSWFRSLDLAINDLLLACNQ